MFLAWFNVNSPEYGGKSLSFSFVKGGVERQGERGTKRTRVMNFQAFIFALYLYQSEVSFPQVAWLLRVACLRVLVALWFVDAIVGQSPLSWMGSVWEAEVPVLGLELLGCPVVALVLG